MSSDRLEADLAGARAYETLHVPALFAQWAPRVLDAARVTTGHRVLDVACGTGVLARAAVDRVGDAGQVVGVDPNAGMLAVAATEGGKVDWREGPAEALPCGDGGFDRVVSQFGMMFFTDRGRALAEMLRVLRPGGLLAVAVWGSLDSSPAYARAVELLDRRAGTNAAAALRAPFELGNRAALEQELANAGAVDVHGTTATGRARFPSIRSMMEAELRGWLPVMGVDLDETLIQSILEEADQTLAEFVGPRGAMVFDAPAHIIVARRSGPAA